MVDTLNIPGLGSLKIIETYAYYDQPILFSCQTATKHLYLVVAADENDQYETWLYAEVSTERLNLIRSGSIDLHDAFAHPESGRVLQVKFPYNSQTEPKIESVQSDQISENMLPIPGECLDFEIDIFPVPNNVKKNSEPNPESDKFRTLLSTLMEQNSWNKIENRLNK